MAALHATTELHHKRSKADESLTAAESTSAAFEQKLFALLQSANQPSGDAVSALRPCPNISRGHWHSLLSEIYSPLGIELHARQNIEELLCRCIINAETLEGALELITRYPENSFLNKLVSQSSHGVTSLFLQKKCTSKAANLLELVSYWKLLSWLIEEPIPLHRVDLIEHCHGDSGSLASQLFQCVVSTGEFASLSFNQRWLSRPILRTYKELRAILALPSLALIPWLPTGSIRSHVWQLMSKSMSRHGLMLSLKEAAYFLDRSPSTLRRQLVREGTSFQTIKNEWRQQQAEELLQTTQYTLEKISGLLGYENTCVFSRAFKSWTGLAPSAYRLARQMPLTKHG